jgi:hypothetical protein
MEEPPRQSWFTTHLAVAVLLSPLAYLLSVGPFVWLARHGLISKATYVNLSLIYKPIAVLRDKSELARQVVDWYVSWFE